MEGQVIPVGELVIADMNARHGFQLHAPFVSTDFLFAMHPFNFEQIEGIQFDRHHDCIHSARVWVPHNQKLGVAGVVDADLNLKADLPAFRWDAVKIEGNDGQASAIIQEFADTDSAFQYFTVAAKSDAHVESLHMTARADQVEDADGNAFPLLAPEVVLYFARDVFTRPERTNSTMELRVRVAGIWYRVQFDATAPVSIDHSNDEMTTWSTLMEHLKSAVGDAWATANTSSTKVRDMVEVRVRVMNKRLSISVGGAQTPWMVPLSGATRQGIAEVGFQQIRLAPGGGDLLPVAPFKAHVWPGGVGTGSSVRTLTVVDVTGDILTVEGNLTGIKPGAVFDILTTSDTGLIEAIEVEAKQFSLLALSAHVTKWAASASALRLPIQAGQDLDPTTLLDFVVHTDAEAYHAQPSVPFSPVFQPSADLLLTPFSSGASFWWRLDYASNQTPWQYLGEDYVDDVMVLTRITSRFAGRQSPPTNAGIRIPLGVGVENPVKQVSESIAFDPASLTINHTASVVCTNWHGLDVLEWQMGMGAYGNVAVEVRTGHYHQQFLSNDGAYGLPRFTGFSPERTFQTSPGGGQALMTIHAVDRMQQLREVQIAAPPDLDGHNHYWAMAYLAQYAGIPITSIAFAPMIPDSPYEGSPLDPDPYFLPMGAGMHPWTPVNRTMPVLELMDQIRKLSGFLMFFDAYGMLRYEPWIPAQQVMAGPKRIFTEGEWESSDSRDPNGGLTSIWNLQSGFSVVDVRNQVVLVGIDAERTWTPMVHKREDAASILSPPGSQPINFKGYRSPFIWFDSRFADWGFSLRSADALFNWFRQPSITVTFQCWGQHDLFPMDLIGVNDWRTRLNGLPFFIMSMQMQTGVMSGRQASECTITARYLDPVVLSSLSG